MMDFNFEGTKESQIEKQLTLMREALLPNGKRMFEDGQAVMVHWKDEEGVIQYEAKQI